MNDQEGEAKCWVGRQQSADLLPELKFSSNVTLGGGARLINIKAGSLAKSFPFTASWSNKIWEDDG